MGDFWSQFFGQVWGLLLFLVGMVLAYIALWAYLRMRRNRIQAEKKAAVMGYEPEKDKKEKKAKAAPAKAKEVAAADWQASLSEPAMSVEDDGDDPLAELYAARAEEAKAELAAPRPPLQTSFSPSRAPQVQEEEVVDLASLLAGMAADAKEYHQIALSPVLVKREDGATTSAKELLSIQRDESDKRLLVQLGELGYRSLLNNASAKSNFTQTMKELSGVILSDDSPPEAPENPSGESHRIAKELLNIRLDNGREASSRELFSILRDESDGHLMIQIGDVAYRSLKQNEQAKTAFTKIMKELSTVVLQPDTVTQVPAAPISYEEVEPSASPNRAEALESTDDLPPGVLRFKKMDELGPTHTVGRFGQVKVSKEKIEVPELNIADAIEKYLQYKIGQNSAFQNRGIHVRPTASGGVRIEAEGKTFEAVDDVANPDIRAFIKQSIAEWQDHH
jgi:hypothetical protein